MSHESSCTRESIPHQRKRHESRLCEVGYTVKTLGRNRPILLAGIRVGVAERSRLGSHRTAKPTVKGFSRVRSIGVKKCRFICIRGRCYREARLYQEKHRRCDSKKRFLLHFGTNHFCLKTLYLCRFPSLYVFEKITTRR